MQQAYTRSVIDPPLGGPSASPNAQARRPDVDNVPPNLDLRPYFNNPNLYQPHSEFLGTSSQYPSLSQPYSYPHLDLSYTFPDHDQSDAYWALLDPQTLQPPPFTDDATAYQSTAVLPGPSSFPSLSTGRDFYNPPPQSLPIRDETFIPSRLEIPTDPTSLANVVAPFQLHTPQTMSSQSPEQCPARPMHMSMASTSPASTLYTGQTGLETTALAARDGPQISRTSSNLAHPRAPRAQQRIRKPVAGSAARLRGKGKAGVEAARAPRETVIPTKSQILTAVRASQRDNGTNMDAEEIVACWRCKRYKKQCDGPGECSNCMKGNFRVWPESLGCRRGCLEDLLVRLIPVHVSLVLTKAAEGGVLVRSWRAQPSRNRRDLIQQHLPSSDRLQRLSLKVQSIGMYGEEFISLFHIISGYLTRQRRQITVLDAAIEVLDATCDIYLNFVENDWPQTPTSIQRAATIAHSQFHRLGKSFVTSALSSSRAEWFPSFLSMCLGINAVIIMLDSAVAIPATWRSLLYPDIIKTAQFMRDTFYPVISDLLRAGTNGSKPFELTCWTLLPDPVTGATVRNAAGLKLVGGDEATFDGMRSLQLWYRQNAHFIEHGSRWANAKPFSDPTAPSIIAMLGLFRYTAKLS